MPTKIKAGVELPGVCPEAAINVLNNVSVGGSFQFYGVWEVGVKAWNPESHQDTGKRQQL